ncbi:nitroreductase [Thermosporothrix hazakensis]|jgi:nitroreductase|uniref:Nitroreductase n=2 Tax=Thermosporothrix TaxID=768650 RepID=A0A326U4L9_THEHA|nr:nitroreductase family protein [Thermosporothrix hazakensis]PZW26687.1 nitroreductase [Thermosporothrix hazakensis]BBH89429.1 putative oxidoreductase [Thermosporothrix sp. COM3]GCE47612.1 putative oxidoreductase [Thermosporothrix hazakensis]
MYLELTPDELLTTTRTVRKRLDFSRPVEPEVIRQCIEIAIQAPTGSNRQSWHFMVVTDAEKRKGLAELYRKSFNIYIKQAQKAMSTLPSERLATQQRIAQSSIYLSEHFHEVPVMVLPCFEGRTDTLPAEGQAAMWGSILPATWSFMLAARARGLGTAWTTLHLRYEREAAELLGIPYERVQQAALLPIAYTIGTNFQPAKRENVEKLIHWDQW